MRYPPDQKARTRERILDAAGVVFRKHGYHAAGVDQVMAEAGLTSGAFYAHFPSKEALLAAMLERVLSRRAEGLIDAQGDGADRRRLALFLRGYLSPTHRDHPEKGCPVPPLISELGRTGEGTRESFEEVLRTLLARFTTYLPGSGEEAEDQALALLALCVGGVALSRAVADPELSQKVLKACLGLALRSLPEDAAQDDTMPHPLG